MNSEVDDLHSHKQTKNFQLTATLTEGKLVVILKDFIEWTIYQKQFSEEDIGKQIHRKLELIDVYSSFCNNCKIDDETKIEAECKNKNTEHMESDGSVMVKQSGKNKYKIQRGGKITTYTQVILQRNGLQVEVIYTSCLQLNKIQKMSEIQMVVAKSEWEKTQIVKKFENKIQDLILENSDLKERVAVLQRNYKWLNDKCQRVSEIVFEIQKKHEEQLNLSKMEIKKMKKLNQNVRLQSTSPFFSKFVVNRGQITYVGQNSSFTQFFIKQQLRQDKVNIFKIKIVRSTSRNLMIGICDVNKQINSRSSYGSGNAFLLYGPGSGYKYPGSVVEGNGYQVGDIVEVQVNFPAKSITWSLNGTYNAGFKDQQMLVDKSRKFLPCIELYDQNECVEWLGLSD